MLNTGTNKIPEGILLFIIAGKEYAVDIKEVSSILNPQQNYSIDIDKKFEIATDGINIDNEIIPLIDIYSLMEIKQPPQTKETRIVVVISNEKKAAFFVDIIKEFVSLDAVNISIMKPVQDKSRLYLKWKLLLDGREIFLFDVQIILSGLQKQI